jgi:hypothetical protein
VLCLKMSAMSNVSTDSHVENTILTEQLLDVLRNPSEDAAVIPPRIVPDT